MKTRALLVVLLLLPGAAWAQGVPAGKEAQDIFQVLMKNFLQQPGRMNEFRLFRDGTVLHGNIVLGGTSTTTTTDFIARAQAVANSARTRFAIPADYQWVVDTGGISERQPVTMMGTWRNVIFLLKIDGVPLKQGFVELMFDAQGRTRKIAISVPRLRPEIVTAVRGPTINSSQAQSSIRTDANALPANNDFMITPNTPLEYIDLKKVARPQPPYIVWECIVNGAVYTVDAKTGAIVSRASREKF